MNKKVCVCVRVLHTHTPPLPLGCVYVCGQAEVGSGNLQPTLVPELSVPVRLCPISSLDLIVFSQGAGPGVSSTSCDPCRHKDIQHRGMVTAEREELCT